MENKKVIHLGDKIIHLSLEEFDYNLDIDSVTKIDASNILGEIMTFSVILNRLGLLLADIDDSLRRAIFNVEIAKDDLKKVKSEVEIEGYKELKKTISSPTAGQIDSYSITNQVYIDEKKKLLDKQKEVLEIQRDRDYLNSLYWSAKSKDEKLNTITTKLSPSEFESEILDGKINGVMVTAMNKLKGM